MIAVVVLLCIFSILICYACLVQGVKAEECSEYQYQEFLRQQEEAKSE